MIDFYKIIENNYIIAIGTNGNDNVLSITEEEYNNLHTLIHNIPKATPGFTYMLRADTMELELIVLPLEDED